MTRMVYLLLTLALTMRTASATPPKFPEKNLDKNGTITRQNQNHHPQTLNTSVFAAGGSLYTERMGFEPMVKFPPHSISSAAPSAARSPLRGAALSLDRVAVTQSLWTKSRFDKLVGSGTHTTNNAPPCNESR